MNKKRKILALSLGTVLSFQAVTPLFAAQQLPNGYKPIDAQQIQSNNDENPLQKYDRYIHVVNNRYQFTAPVDSNIPYQDVVLIQKTLQKTNESLEETNVIINPETKEGVLHVKSNDHTQNRNYGINGIYWHWWGFSLYLNKYWTNQALHFGIGGIFGAVGTVISSAVAGGLIGGIAALVGGWNVNSGINIHVNYAKLALGVGHGMDYFRWQ